MLKQLGLSVSSGSIHVQPETCSVTLCEPQITDLFNEELRRQGSASQHPNVNALAQMVIATLSLHAENVNMADEEGGECVFT